MNLFEDRFSIYFQFRTTVVPSITFIHITSLKYFWNSSSFSKMIQSHLQLPQPHRLTITPINPNQTQPTFPLSQTGPPQGDKTTSYTSLLLPLHASRDGLQCIFFRICSLSIIFSFSIMKQILQAKVNLLIEKNRLEIEQKEKEKKSKSKLKAKNSFSHYEEPSKNVKFQTRGGRAQRVGEKMKAKTINKQEEQSQKAQTFQKRFQEVEREKNKEISLEELQKQQYYLQQILNNLNLKVNRLTLKIVKENLNNHKILKKTKTNPNLRTISRNLTENGTQTPIIYAYQQQNNNDQTSLLQTPQNSNYSKLDHETELNQSRMSQLSVQYTHLQSELLKYIKKGNDQQNDSLDLQSSQLIFNKQIHELEVLIRNRKKSIKELKKFLNKIPEHERKDCEPDKNEEVKGQIDYKSLKAQIYKRTLANEQKKQHLQQLQQQEGKSIINIQGLQKTRLLFEQQLSSKDNKDKQFPQPTLSVNPPSPSPCKLKHKTTLSVNNALSPEQLQQKYDYLLRKKQILQRSRESQLAKWRQIYKQKMRKLVSEYSHISQIHGMALKLETNKHMRDEEIEEYQTRSNLGWSSLY